MLVHLAALVVFLPSACETQKSCKNEVLQVKTGGFDSFLCRFCCFVL